MNYGRLVIIGTASHVGGRPALLCRCECGNEVAVQRKRLFSGHTKSCGCLQKQVWSELLSLHHQAVRTHGLTGSKEWNAWAAMKSRVDHQNLKSGKYYREKRVSVALEWREDFKAFLAHIGPAPSSDHSVDRIRSDGDYEPGNVRWATLSEQNRNKSDNIWVTVDDKPRLLIELSEETGIPYKTLYWRICRAKWPVNRALSEPINARARFAANYKMALAAIRPAVA